MHATIQSGYSLLFGLEQRRGMDDVDVAAPGRDGAALSGNQACSDVALDGTLENLRASAIAVDDDGLIVAVNSAAQNLLSRKPQNSSVRTSTTCCTGTDTGTRCRARAAKSERRSSRVPPGMVTPSGSPEGTALWSGCPGWSRPTHPIRAGQVRWRGCTRPRSRTFTTATASPLRTADGSGPPGAAGGDDHAAHIDPGLGGGTAPSGGSDRAPARGLGRVRPAH